MYILLTSDDAVAEVIPDKNPIFPGVSITERYAPDFIAKLMHVPDDTEVKQNWVYNTETGKFTEPKPLEPIVIPATTPATPTASA